MSMCSHRSSAFFSWQSDVSKTFLSYEAVKTPFGIWNVRSYKIRSFAQFLRLFFSFSCISLFSFTFKYLSKSLFCYFLSRLPQIWALMYLVTQHCLTLPLLCFIHPATLLSSYLLLLLFHRLVIFVGFPKEIMGLWCLHLHPFISLMSRLLEIILAIMSVFLRAE